MRLGAVLVEVVRFAGGLVGHAQVPFVPFKAMEDVVGG